MAEWHGYFVVERKNIGAGNWANLQALFEAMGTDDSPFPCYNNHYRTRLDANAVIYESLFDTEEVSMTAFKQLLADEFGVNVEDIYTVIDNASYAGNSTTIWTYYYNEITEGKDRFIVERFGGGGSTWNESYLECHGYLAIHKITWGD